MARLPIMVALLLLASACRAPHRAHEGVLDLRAKDLYGAELTLAGEWELFWQRPAEGAPDAYLPAEHWRGERLFDGRRLPAFGWATYRLKILVPKGNATALALALEPVDTAYQLRIETVSGRPLITPAGVGVVGHDAAKHRAAFRRLHASFTASEDFYVVLEVSNFDIRTGGPWSVPVLANAGNIADEVRAERDREYLLFGVIMMMALHNLGIFLLHRRERGPLWLFTFTLLIAIRTQVTGRFITEEHARQWWSLLTRVEYLTFYLGIPAVVLFLQSALPRQFSPRFVRGVVIACAPFVASLLLTPAWVFTETLMPFQVMTIALIVWMLAKLMDATRSSGDVLPWLVLAGIAVLAGTAINDILHQLIKTPYVVAYGEGAFLVCQSLVVAVINHRARQQAEASARETMTLNDELRRQIGDRSHRLSQMLSALAFDQRERSTLAPGSVMAQRYRIDGLLGEGGMGAVYAAVRLADGKELALKVIRMDGGAEVLARFAREAEAAATVSHPNVVSIIDLDVGERGELFIVMERVHGSALDAQRIRFGERTWALPILRQLAHALQAIHRAGVVHRDLKPGNILVDEAGVLKVADFGIAVLRREERATLPESTAATLHDRPSKPPGPRGVTSDLTRTGVVLGSPWYMGPEAARGAQFATTQGDMFSFGVIAFEMLSGRRPFERPIEELPVVTPPPPLRELCPGLEGALPALIDACLRMNPAERPTVDALVEALDAQAVEGGGALLGSGISSS